MIGNLPLSDTPRDAFGRRSAQRDTGDRNLGPVDSGLASEAGPIVECTVGSVCMGGEGADGGMHWECCVEQQMGDSPIVLTSCP